MRMAYLDTCCLIYLLEDVPPFSARIRKLLANNMAVTLCLSPLVRMEVLVKPMMDANAALIADYEDFIAAQQWLPIGNAVFESALRLRVQHRLKTPDALHLACAQHHACTEFWTNDDRLTHAAASSMVVRTLTP